MSNQLDPVIPGDKAASLLSHISTWGPVTTTVRHLGSVFEYKGDFPAGTISGGYYHLRSGGHGLEGKLRLSSLDHVTLQQSYHGGRISCAFSFNDGEGDSIFKIFLGRDRYGDIYTLQLDAFCALEAKWSKSQQPALEGS